MLKETALKKHILMMIMISLLSSRGYSESVYVSVRTDPKIAPETARHISYCLPDDERSNLCADVAARKGLNIKTGRADCSPVLLYWETQQNADEKVDFKKTLKMTFMESQSDSNIVHEVTSSLFSPFKKIRDTSIIALCNAAFDNLLDARSEGNYLSYSEFNEVSKGSVGRPIGAYNLGVEISPIRDGSGTLGVELGYLINERLQYYLQAERTIYDHVGNGSGSQKETHITGGSVNARYFLKNNFYGSVGVMVRKIQDEWLAESPGSEIWSRDVYASSESTRIEIPISIGWRWYSDHKIYGLELIGASQPLIVLSKGNSFRSGNDTNEYKSEDSVDLKKLETRSQNRMILSVLSVSMHMILSYPR